MELKAIINVKELTEVLGMIKSLKPGSSKLSILSTVRVVGNNHNLTIYGTNLKTNVIATLKNREFINFDICIHFDSLLKALKSIDTFYCDLVTIDDNYFLLSQDRKEKYKLTTLSSENFPEFTKSYKKELCIQNSLLQQTLKNALPCVSTDETRYFLGGVLFENVTGNKNINLVATDGRRLNFNEIETWTDEKDFKDTIVDPVGLKLYTSIKKLDGYSDITINDKFCIRNTYNEYQLEIQCYIIEGQFPRYERIVNYREEANNISLDVKQLSKAAAKVSKFVNKRTKRSFFHVIDKCLTFSSDEDISLELAPIIEMDNISVALNISFIQDILKNTQNEIVDIYLGDSNSPCYFRHDNGLTMIQPMQLD